MKKLNNLSKIEMININGGGLVEDLGYAYHAVECNVTKAYHKVKSEISSWFNQYIDYYTITALKF